MRLGARKATACSAEQRGTARELVLASLGVMPWATSPGFPGGGGRAQSRLHLHIAQLSDSEVEVLQGLGALVWVLLQQQLGYLEGDARDLGAEADRGAHLQCPLVVGPRLLPLKQYQGYFKKVTAGETGRLTPSRGETPAAVRRRLGAAARAPGVQLTVKRLGDPVYLWR